MDFLPIFIRRIALAVMFKFYSYYEKERDTGSPLLILQAITMWFNGEFVLFRFPHFEGPYCDKNLWPGHKPLQTFYYKLVRK